MRKLMLTLGVAAIAIAAPALSQGRGQGQGGGGDHKGGGRDHKADQGQRGQGAGHGRTARQGGGRDEARGGRGEGRGAGRQAMRHDNPGRGRDDDARGRGRDHGEDRARGPASARAKDVRRDVRDARAERRGRGRVERRAVLVTNPGNIARLRFAPDRAFVRGCPPGLARKNNGCLPPGQARQLLAERNWYGSWWPRYGDGNYRYWNGNLYRFEPSGSVAGFIPLAGGALWLGNSWPASYAYDPVPDYYRDYHGWDDAYDYRYSDGIVYGLDPESQLIREVSGLLTGDDWAVGGRMPEGYDIYNVPYAYRDEYRDTPDDWYRYSDGHMYRVDPTTQLIEAAIRLIV